MGIDWHASYLISSKAEEKETDAATLFCETLVENPGETPERELRSLL
jgi:hypothetical protein